MSSKLRDDPRDASLEISRSLPPGWTTNGSDDLGSSSMMLGGLTVMSRNPMLAWFTITFGMWGWLNQRPLRTKGAGAAGTGMIIGIAALLSAYLPKFMLEAPS